MSKRSINRNFLMKVRKRFDERTRSKLSKTILNIPTVKQFETIYTTNASVDDLILWDIPFKITFKYVLISILLL